MSKVWRGKRERKKSFHDKLMSHLANCLQMYSLKSFSDLPCIRKEVSNFWKAKWGANQKHIMHLFTSSYHLLFHFYSQRKTAIEIFIRTILVKTRFYLSSSFLIPLVFVSFGRPAYPNLHHSWMHNEFIIERCIFFCDK